MCGVFGIISDEPVADAVHQGIVQLQHRGQDGAGLFTYDPRTGEHQIHRAKGLVTEAFAQHTNLLPKATWGIGHVRYSTAGTGGVEDTQPQTVEGDHVVSMVQNGNVVNYVPMKRRMEEEGFSIETSCDGELIVKLFASKLPKGSCSFDDICNAVEAVYEAMPGAYSVVGIVGGEGMIAFRDPAGVRPLLHGVEAESNAHVFASETEALSFLGCQNISDVTPGEVVWVDREKRVHRRLLKERPRAHCCFEWVYFAKPNTLLEGSEVYQTRARLGRCLAKKVKTEGIEIDTVVPVPDSGRPAAIALARELALDYEEGFVKKDHVGRTFIMPTQAVREKALSRKLAVTESVFRGKNVLLVDDSIVRGTVSRKVVRLARLAGAKSVYFASSFPPIRHPCFYGIDFPRQEKLMGYGRTPEQIAQEIDADGVFYNDIQGLKEAIGMETLCMACLDARYPVDTSAAEELQQLRSDELEAMELACRV